MLLKWHSRLSSNIVFVVLERALSKSGRWFRLHARDSENFTVLQWLNQGILWIFRRCYLTMKFWANCHVVSKGEGWLARAGIRHTTSDPLQGIPHTQSRWAFFVDKFEHLQAQQLQHWVTFHHHINKRVSHAHDTDHWLIRDALHTFSLHSSTFLVHFKGG